MYGDVTHHWNSKRYRSTTVEVPRCEECWTAHQPAQKTKSSAGCFGALGFMCMLLGFIFALASSGSTAGFVIGIVGLLTLVISLVVGASTGNAEESRAMQYPPVAELKQRGWQKGTRPA
ncbi:hypothetical protein BJF90_39950 [Pseudonocardia sp. CNS-004]|nr:hypothetical protein BJF90_39950 [Pseudonocardia sp. CNS-004]